MKPARLRLLAAAVALAAAGACSVGAGTGTPAVQTAGGPVKVAVVDVLSGPSASLGVAVRNSVQLQVDQLNAGGGLLGRRVELVVADDELKPDKAGALTRQVLEDGAVRLLVGPSLAGLFLSARPAIAGARVPNCVAQMAADDLMAEAPFTFRNQESTASRIPSLLAYVQKGTQVRRLGLLTEGDAFGVGYDRQLLDEAGKFGLQYVGAASVPAAGDVRSLIQVMLQRGAEGVVLPDSPGAAGRVLQAIKQVNAQSRLRTFGLGGLGAYAFPQQAGDLAAGVVFVSTIQAYMSDVPDTAWPPLYRDLVRGVVSKFGRESNGVEIKGSAAAADCVVQWSRAVRNANSFDGPKVVKAWEMLDLPPAQNLLGVRETFSSTDHDAVPPDGLFVYQWGKTGAQWGLKQLAGPA